MKKIIQKLEYHPFLQENLCIPLYLKNEKKLYSQDLIKWKIIEWGIENKMNWFDFAGANPKPQNQKEEGILRYKKKWGGKQYQYYIIGK